jgi:hypothetical protein
VSKFTIGCLVACVTYVATGDAETAADNGRWKHMPNVSLLELIHGAGDDHREVMSTNTAALSWSDGRQAIATTLHVRGKHEPYLYRCIDYFDDSMRHTGQICYRAR